MTRLLRGGMLSAVLPMAALVAVAAQAGDFRIETKVFVGEEPEPVSGNVTLFYKGVVYDFLGTEKISVFRKASEKDPGRFILLDPARQIRTEVTTDEILRYTTGLQDWAIANEDPLLKFVAQPKFAEQFDEREGRLTLTHDAVTYQLLTMSAEADASKQYKEFSDWFARVSAMLYPGGLTPFPRLVVNTALSQRSLIPREVHLTAPSFKSRPALDVRSEHKVIWRLSKRDLDQIDAAQEYLAKFKLVPRTDWNE